MARSGAFNDLTLDEVLLGDFRPFHIGIAKDELAKAKRGDATWKQYQTFTDNQFAKPIQNVKLFGKIEFASEGMSDAIRHVWTKLNELAVRIWRDGGYHDSLRMYVPGKGTFTGYEQVPQDAQEVHFYSIAPYARKIELGLSSKAKSGVFKPTFNSAKGIYGRSVKLTFSYTVPRDGASVTRTNRKSKKTRRAGGGSYSAPVPSPIIYMTQGGFFQ